MQNNRGKFLSQVKSLWQGRVLPFWKASTSLIAKLLGVLLICVLFKYLFLTNCLDLQGMKACATSSLNDTSTLFTLGGLLLALFVMIPTFWIDSRIKDATKEVKEEILTNIREDMQKLSQAQMLLFEANRIGAPSSYALKEAEIRIKQVVDIWPPFKQQAYRDFAITASKIIIDSAYREQFGYISPRSSQIRHDEIPWFITTAMYYLEETVRNNSSLDKEALIYLACIYGYQEQYDQVIKTVERAIKIDEDAKEEFQKPEYLSMLIRACGRDRTNIEGLGRKVGLKLPVSKEPFRQFLSSFDLVNWSGFIQWIAINRTSVIYAPYLEQNLVSIKIYAHDGANGRRVNAVYKNENDPSPVHIGQADPDKQITIEGLFNELNQRFFLICYAPHEAPEYAPI